MATIRGEYESLWRMRDKAEAYIAIVSKCANFYQDRNNASKNLKKYKTEIRKYEHFVCRDESEWFKPIIEPAVVTIYSLESKK